MEDKKRNWKKILEFKEDVTGIFSVFANCTQSPIVYRGLVDGFPYCFIEKEKSEDQNKQKKKAEMTREDLFFILKQVKNIEVATHFLKELEVVFRDIYLSGKCLNEEKEPPRYKETEDGKVKRFIASSLQIGEEFTYKDEKCVVLYNYSETIECDTLHSLVWISRKDLRRICCN